MNDDELANRHDGYKKIFEEETILMKKKYEKDLEHSCMITAKIIESENERIKAIQADQKRAEEVQEIRIVDHQIWCVGRKIYDETMKQTLESEKARTEYYKLKITYMKEKLNPIKEIEIKHTTH